MIKKLLWVSGFFILGIVSLYLWSRVDAHFCELYPKLCMPKVGQCNDIEHCSMSFFRKIGIISIIFGPPVIFATTAYIRAKEEKSLTQWAYTWLLLVIVHGVIMTAFRIITTRL